MPPSRFLTVDFDGRVYRRKLTSRARTLLVPFVLGYIAWVWWKMDRTKLTQGEIDQAGDDEIY